MGPRKLRYNLLWVPLEQGKREYFSTWEPIRLLRPKKKEHRKLLIRICVTSKLYSLVEGKNRGLDGRPKKRRK